MKACLNVPIADVVQHRRHRQIRTQRRRDPSRRRRSLPTDRQRMRPPIILQHAQKIAVRLDQSQPPCVDRSHKNRLPCRVIRQLMCDACSPTDLRQMV